MQGLSHSRLHPNPPLFGRTVFSGQFGDGPAQLNPRMPKNTTPTPAPSTQPSGLPTEGGMERHSRTSPSHRCADHLGYISPQANFYVRVGSSLRHHGTNHCDAQQRLPTEGLLPLAHTDAKPSNYFGSSWDCSHRFIFTGFSEEETGVTYLTLQSHTCLSPSAWPVA